jgi:hypothetical protein
MSRVRRYSRAKRDDDPVVPTRLSRSVATLSRRLRVLVGRSWRSAARRVWSYNPAVARPAGLAPQWFGQLPVRSPLRSLVCGRRSRLIGCLPPRSPLCFQRASRYFVDHRPPSLSQRVHPPVSFASPSEFSGSYPPRSARAEPLPWGSLPLCGISVASPQSRASQARFVPSSGFLTLSTVSSSPHLAGLFRPATTSGILPSGAFPPPQPCPLVEGRFPPAVCLRLLPYSRRAPAAQTRLQGLAPRRSP